MKDETGNVTLQEVIKRFPLRNPTGTCQAEVYRDAAGNPKACGGKGVARDEVKGNLCTVHFDKAKKFVEEAVDNL